MSEPQMTADENDYADLDQRDNVVYELDKSTAVNTDDNLSAKSAPSKLSAVQTMFDQLKTNTALQMSKIPPAGKDAGVEFKTM